MAADNQLEAFPHYGFRQCIDTPRDKNTLMTCGSTTRLGKFGEIIMQIDVYALPSLLPAEDISDATAIVVDTLRATTSLVYASANGLRRIIPVLDVEEARQLKRSGINGTVPLKDIILGGERNGERCNGFDLGNSPRSFRPEEVMGKTLIFTSTNGTVAMNAVRSAKQVLLGALVNSKAVVRKAEKEEKIIIVCAGTDGKETSEDLLTAGCLVTRLYQGDMGKIHLNDAAVRVRWMWKRTVVNRDKEISEQKLLDSIGKSAGGKNLLRIGYGEDVEAAAQMDLFNIVPII